MRSIVTASVPPRFVGLAPGLFVEAFDVLPDSAAVLDERGVIVAVNRAWCGFAARNGGRADGYLGTNYLAICGPLDADAPGCADVADLRQDLAALLAGETQDVSLEYPCHSPTGPAYFMMHATCFEHAGRRYALVRHVNITDRKLLELEAVERATHDDLTGLPTRAKFTNRLEQSLARAERHGDRLAVFALDLDGFKAINDTHGHGAGDAVLKAVAERLRATVRAVDALSRVGGDEFLLMAEEAHEWGALRLAERVHERLAEPVEVDGVQCTVGTSIGIAFYPDDARTIDGLLECADQAMYRAKSAGKGRAVLYAERVRSAELPSQQHA